MLWEDNKRDKYAVNNRLYPSIQKEDAHIERDIKNKLISIMYGTILAFLKLINNFGTRHLNGPRHLFHSFCCTTRRIFEPLRVYELGFNSDKYGICIYIYIYIYISLGTLVPNSRDR